MKKKFFFTITLILFGLNISNAKGLSKSNINEHSVVNFEKRVEQNVDEHCRKKVSTDADFSENWLLNEKLKKEIESRKSYLSDKYQQHIDSLRTNQTALGEKYHISDYKTSFMILYFPFLLALVAAIYLGLSIYYYLYDYFVSPSRHWFTRSIAFMFCFFPCLLFLPCFIYYNKRVLWEKMGEQITDVQSEWKQKSNDVHLQDPYLISLYEKQRKTEQVIETYKDSVRGIIQTLEEKKLKDYICKNNIQKKLKIIVCSWEKQPDIPEHGAIDGNFGASGSSILGIGGLDAKGKLHGEYTGRVYGNEYHFFHFVLSDNSYHMIDASKNKVANGAGTSYCPI